MKSAPEANTTRRDRQEDKAISMKSDGSCVKVSVVSDEQNVHLVWSDLNVHVIKTVNVIINVNIKVL